ncbi:MAG TPA: copper transporter, partial [Actinomycetota bacterium]|nr:copper transporter [Actinomycetota bacterium]
MISFRFHLVSIVAVFLALALGVLVGTTVVSQGVISDLERRADEALQRSEELRDQVGELQADLRSWEAFGASVEPLLVGGQLAGRGVVVVTQEDVDPAELDGVLRALQESGATSLPVLVLTDRLALADGSSQAELAAALGSAPGGDPVALAAEAARRLAHRLAAGPGPEPDLLEQLVAGGFLALR